MKTKDTPNDSKNDSKNDSENGKGANGSFKIPSNFNLVTPIEGASQWWKPEVGAILYGRLLGRFARKDGTDGAYFQVRVEKYTHANLPPVKAITGKGDEAKTIIVDVGGVVNVDERSAIKPLAGYANSDGVFNALIHVLEKAQISGGRTYWRMEARTEQLKAPTTPIVQPIRSATDDMGASY